MRRGLTAVRRILLTAAITAFVMWGLLYAPTPYLVYEPGIAVPVEPMIALESGASADGGQFLLTAVKLIEPNLWGVLKATVNRDRDVYQKSSVFGNYTKEQYAERLTVIMEGSQYDAVEAAYRYLSVPYEVKTEAIVITDIIRIAEQPVGRLRAGDKLLRLDGGEAFQSVESAADQVIKALEGKADGTSHSVMIEIERGGKQMMIELEPSVSYADSAAQSDEKRLALLLGAKSFVELRTVEATHQKQRLSISAGEIGGPSAGLVFTLGAIDLLTEGDLTQGARIAATGTISPDGKVGAIGGIKQKVVSTSGEGAELFLVPKANERDALSKSKSIKTDMKIVGVDTLQDALDAIAAFASNRINV
ncbi:S16 family serine protease [Paenibacillus sp. 1011MAR3C5]|uniref:S16 family serine protease n=1 Tax=Paenibacillus sp. 1011MAR3C5 TaxID=1675787 RepID=UPI001602B573|nr:S16 family serine protease [Paenibacillus sp. 1011MAR3C5]